MIAPSAMDTVSSAPVYHHSLIYWKSREDKTSNGSPRQVPALILAGADTHWMLLVGILCDWPLHRSERLRAKAELVASLNAKPADLAAWAADLAGQAALRVD